MNGDLLPAVAAATGGSALISGIWAYERTQTSKMRASRKQFGLRFPSLADGLRAKAALAGLAGLSSDNELILELKATAEGIRFGIQVPESVRASSLATLAGAMPGLRTPDAPTQAGRAAIAVKVFIPTPTVFTSGDPDGAERTLLGGLAGLDESETVVLRWALRPGPPPELHGAEPLDRRTRAIHQAWRQKTLLGGGFQVAGLVLVRGATITRARALAAHVTSAIRSRRGGVGSPRMTFERGRRGLASLPRVTRTSGWLNTAELLPLLGWPLGDELIPGVEVGLSRELAVPTEIPHQGRKLFIGRDARGERPVALSPDAARHHMTVVGPSGVGKSVLLARSILEDIRHGFGGAVIDPKADLIETVLNRVGPADADRVVVLDPAASRIPGVAVLKGGDPDLRAEALTGALRSAFPAEAWGIRTDYYLRLGIRTLAGVREATLADIGRLFFEEPFRRDAVSQLRDPFLIAAWQSYESLSAGSQAEHLQAPMARVMALLSRPKVRAILAAPDPQLDVAKLLRERRWLLVSLAPGTLGESGAAIVGAALMYVIWSAIEARVTLEPAKRHPVFLYVDELATLTNGLPFSFEQLAERARGLGAGLTVALQTLSRIPEPTRSAVLVNAATFITFRATEDTQRLARQLPGLTEADVMALGRFEVAARIGTGTGSAVATTTGRTEALPAETGQAAAIRLRSTERYGRAPEEPQPRDDRADAETGSLGRTRRAK